ncbi:spore germination protein KB [Paenibacillus catalpae]|uniref:Spore germination protein KB n=1 Tax=Paenibacillus catalpae TaxID=1045775 RepID=A0A1I1V916_9BACL|nr:endospore germination permease [Paenibacillus catalpae]SFD79487.1 spore germination protein KB [Paenibacillus catalpae]
MSDRKPEQQEISSFQLGVIFFAYMTGSSIINIPGPLIGRAYNGAWLSLLISGALGFCILACILFLNQRYPGLSFVECGQRLIGTWLTIMISIFTLSFLLQMISGIVLDIGLFMVSSMMRETPLYVFTFLAFAISAATAYAGIEVIARMFTLIAIVLLLMIGLVLVLALNHYNPSSLLPIMPDGMKPILHGAYFTFGFPYVEVFLIAMLLPFVSKETSPKLPRTLLTSLALNVLIICISSICTIMAFGPLAGKRPYALFSLAHIVEFQEIVQRIESIIGISLILGSFMKTTVTLYVLSLYLTQLFKLSDNRIFIMPLALLGFMITLVGFDGSAEWTEIVSVLHPIWGSAAFVVPLLLVMVVAIFKGKILNGKS